MSREPGRQKGEIEKVAADEGQRVDEALADDLLNCRAIVLKRRRRSADRDGLGNLSFHDEIDGDALTRKDRDALAYHDRRKSWELRLKVVQAV